LTGDPSIHLHLDEYLGWTSVAALKTLAAQFVQRFHYPRSDRPKKTLMEPTEIWNIDWLECSENEIMNFATHVGTNDQPVI
jgi:hypothetical protein